jgi:hypothetical protein
MDKGVTQREKRQVMENDRQVRVAATYHSVAQAALDDERGGRYAAGSGSKASVVGTSPISYPTQPPGSPWAKDECPPEPPLGFSVDEQEPVGEMFERASIADGTSVIEGNGPGAVMSSPPRSGRGFRRRA